MLSEFYIPEVVSAAKTLEDLDDALLVLRLDLGKLEAAWGRAFAPITARVVPALDTAVRAVTDFVEGAGHVIAALFGGVEVQAEKTVRVTGRAVKRSLADFDRLDRLSTGSGSGSSTYTVPAQLKAIPAEYQKIADRIREILAPIMAIDLSAACDAFGRLREAVAPLTRGLFSALEWAWFNILTPMAAWGAEQALPAFLDALAGALQVVSAAISAVRPVLSWLWQELLKPLGQWAGETLLDALGRLTGWFGTLAGCMERLRPLAQVLTDALGFLHSGFLRVCSALGLFDGAASAVGVGLSWLQQLGRGLTTVFASVVGSVSSLYQKLVAVAGALPGALRQAANVAVGMVNTVLRAVEAAVNAMVSALNTIRIDIPGWVPLVGGKRLAMDLSYVSLPRVPALARGAVLPANKPFLAVVGDQKNGTNIEAPLGLIQEAVASVLSQSADVQQDTNRLLAQLLDAVAAIRVGDDTIGRAARRYESRMAVMGGVR